MACFTDKDIGGCGCSASCSPCPLPAANLTLTTVVPAGPGAGTNTTTLAYTAGAVQTWVACVPLSIAGGSPSHKFTLGCKPGACTYVNVDEWTGAGCTGTDFPGVYDWNSAAGGPPCAGIDPANAGGQDLTLSGASTCSPLNMTWTNIPGVRWTVTP